MDRLWFLLFVLREELLLFSGFWIIISGIDDLAVDLLWGVRRGWRRITRYKATPPMRADQLRAATAKGPLAIFIPAWQESAVIGPMLARCIEAWRSSGIEHRIYVGCYANDAATISAVIRAALVNRQIQLILCERPGPTTKADCLNRLWQALTADELMGGFKVKAIILHDAEDEVHPLELRVVDYLIERAAAVQLPVIPVQVTGSAWVSGHYCDEFAEAHAKTLVVREAMGAAVPLAGVGCAIERNRLGRIAIAHDGNPFDANSLTEDYELGLHIGTGGGKVIFARMLDADGELVGTRACFPDSFGAATRQKARWMTGIALAGWDRLGWCGGIAEFWMRLRDRKALFAAIVLVSAYLCILLSAVLMLAERAGLYTTPASSSTVQVILILTLILLTWRIVIRFGFVLQAQGWRHAFLSIPRGIVANAINIIAARRAATDYARLLVGGKLCWDKTSHAHFPGKTRYHG
jgi:bacteriophage N4 adsorption protein B